MRTRREYAAQWRRDWVGWLLYAAVLAALAAQPILAG